MNQDAVNSSFILCQTLLKVVGGGSPAFKSQAGAVPHPCCVEAEVREVVLGIFCVWLSA